MYCAILMIALTAQCSSELCLTQGPEVNYGIDLRHWKQTQNGTQMKPAYVYIFPTPRTFKLYVYDAKTQRYCELPHYKGCLTPLLEPGKTYSYKIRAEWPDGIGYEICKNFKAGDTVLFQFDYADAYIQTYRNIGEKIRNFDKVMEWVENDLQQKSAQQETQSQLNPQPDSTPTSEQFQTQPQTEPTNQVASQESAIPNFGIDPGYLREKQVMDVQNSLSESTSAIEAEQKLIDDSGKLRLTIIGPKELRKKVLADLQQFPEHTKSFVVKDYDPTDWEVANYKFKTDGTPTIYIQTPEGKVLHRQDTYNGIEDLKTIFTKVRVPDPNYDPKKDPDLRDPTINAGVKEFLQQYSKEMTLLGIVFLVLAWVVKLNG